MSLLKVKKMHLGPYTNPLSKILLNGLVMTMSELSEQNGRQHNL